MLYKILLITLSIMMLTTLVAGCKRPITQSTNAADNTSAPNDEKMLVPFSTAEVDNPIRINQIGYKPDSQKIAVFANVDNSVKSFKVVSKTGEVVFENQLSMPQINPMSGEVIRIGDFSKVTDEGTYYIEIDSCPASYYFKIGDNVYDSVSNALTKMFYYQRCGQALSEEHAGVFAHGACHTLEAKIYGTEDTLEVSGGWHDAGDYGRYITPAAKALIDLMLSYENFPEKFTDTAGIDESGSGAPDILDEIKYELDFFIKMQDMQTGGVYHKVTTKAFTSVWMPDAFEEKQILCPMSGMATADFAAVMAKAYTLYNDIDQEFADTCLLRAELAWQWLMDNPHEQSFENPDYITTGEYGDTSSQDERFWAACELYLATQNNKYHEYIQQSQIYTGLGWSDMGMYGVITYLKLPNGAYDEDLYNAMLQKLTDEADKIVKQSKTDLYQTTLEEKDYKWGSNMIVANNAILLLIANEYSPKSEYVDIAFEQLNYLLGKNPLGISYITNFGTHYAHNPHHRMVETKRACFDGLVVGGPNANLEDAYARASFIDTPPAQCYADVNKSYSTNEVTIYWNSPVVYLVYYFR